LASKNIRWQYLRPSIYSKYASSIRLPWLFDQKDPGCVPSLHTYLHPPDGAAYERLHVQQDGMPQPQQQNERTQCQPQGNEHRRSHAISRVALLTELALQRVPVLAVAAEPALVAAPARGIHLVGGSGVVVHIRTNMYGVSRSDNLYAVCVCRRIHPLLGGLRGGSY
jgi:hypothetical protein